MTRLVRSWCYRRPGERDFFVTQERCGDRPTIGKCVVCGLGIYLFEGDLFEKYFREDQSG